MSKNTNKTVKTNLIEEVVAKVENANLIEFQKVTNEKSIEKVTLEKVKNAIELFNALEKEQKTLDNVTLIEKMITKVNAEEKNKVVSQYVSFNHTDLIKALSIVKIDIKEKDNASQITNKVKNAISYTVYKLDEKENAKVLTDRQKALVIDDIIQAKAQLIANKRADNTPTKEDTTKAKAQIYNDIIKGILYCSCNVACMLEKITDTKIKHTPEFLKASKALETIYTQQNKENPFDKISRNALEQQLKIALSTCINSNELDTKVKKYYGDLFVKMLVTTNSNNGLQKELQTDEQILQALIIVARYVNNEIIPQFKHNKTIHTTK